MIDKNMKWEFFKQETYLRYANGISRITKNRRVIVGIRHSNVDGYR